MAIPFFLARAAQRDFMQDGDVVPDDGGFPYHETGGVVQQDAAADGGRRMDVHREYFTGQALELKGHDRPVMLPQPVGDAVRGDGVEPLVKKQGFQRRTAGGIPVHDGDQVLGYLTEDVLVFRQRFPDKGLNQLPRHVTAGELAGQPRRDGSSQGIAGQADVVQNAAHGGFFLSRSAGAFLHPFPYSVNDAFAVGALPEFQAFMAGHGGKG